MLLLAVIKSEMPIQPKVAAQKTRLTLNNVSVMQNSLTFIIINS